MYSKVAVAAALVGYVSAWAYPAADAQINKMLVARQAASTAGGGQCAVPSNILSIVETLPTPPADLESAIATITDYCATPSFTGALEAEWTSYEAAVLSWAVANSAPLESYEAYLSTNCPQLTTAANNVPICTKAPAASASGITAGAAGGTATSKGDAPVQTAMAAAFGLVAGAIGVLVL
jgi:hypothetical protein